MNQINIFTDINPSEKEAMMHCFQANIKHYKQGSTIMNYSNKFNKIGIIQQGQARLYMIDHEGRANMLATLNENDVFGELFTLPLEENEYYMEAVTECDVIFIGYEHIIKRCEKACPHHSQLINNLFQMSAETTRNLGCHLHILSQRSLRYKLSAYFNFLFSNQQKNPITIPISFSSLSDYLCVDRSAMMRELKKMNEEGLIASKGKKITLMGLSH